jgi:hypothetical protein
MTYRPLATAEHLDTLEEPVRRRRTSLRIDRDRPVVYLGWPNTDTPEVPRPEPKVVRVS